MGRTFASTSIRNTIIAGLLTSAALLSGCANQHQDRPSSSQVLSSTSPDALYRIGEKLREAGEYDRALQFYQDTLKSDPAYIPALISIGKTYSVLGQFEPAQKAFEQVLAAESDNTLAKREIGFLYLQQNKPDLCIKTLLEIHEQEPQNTSVLNGLAICHDLKGDPQAAQEWYKEALQIAPDHAGILSNLGLSHTLSGNYTMGLNLLKQAAGKPLATPREHHNLALAYGLSGQLDKAKELYRRDLDEVAVQKNIDYIRHVNNNGKALESKDIFASLTTGKMPSKIVKKPLAPVKDSRPPAKPVRAKHVKKPLATVKVSRRPAKPVRAKHKKRAKSKNAKSAAATIPSPVSQIAASKKIINSNADRTVFASNAPATEEYVKLPEEKNAGALNEPSNAPITEEKTANNP